MSFYEVQIIWTKNAPFNFFQIWLFQDFETRIFYEINFVHENQKKTWQENIKNLCLSFEFGFYEDMLITHLK